MGAPLAIASLAVAGLSAGFQAVGAYGQASSQRASFKYQSRVAQNNKLLADRAAADALARGDIAERQQRIKTMQLMGMQRAMFAGNGVDVNAGSAVDIVGDSAALGELDALTVRNNAAREAHGFRSQGMNFQAQSNLYRSSASGINSWFSGAGALTSGLGSVAEKWYTLKSAGAFD